MVLLHDVAEYRRKRQSVSKHKYISTENMLQQYMGITPYTDFSNIEGIEYCVGDTLIGNIRPYLKKVWFASFNGACSADVLALKPNGVNPEFLYDIIAQDDFIEYVMSGVKGSKMPRGDKSHIMNYETAFPSLTEQEKIAYFLRLLSTRIQKLQLLIDSLKKYKRGVSNRIFAEAESWEQVAFLDVFSTVPDKPYQVVTSEYYDFGSYEVVDQGKNDIVGYNNDLSKVFSAVPIIVYGDHTTIIKYRNTPFIVGGDGVKLLTTRTNNNLQYLYYALCQHNIQPEGYKRHFSIVKNLNIPIPSLEKQQAIAKVLATVDLKIKKEDEMLERLLLQKKAFLQQIFI